MCNSTLPQFPLPKTFNLGQEQNHHGILIQGGGEGAAATTAGYEFHYAAASDAAATAFCDDATFHHRNNGHSNDKISYNKIPKWDGKQLTVHVFLTQLESYKGDSYFVALSNWTMKRMPNQFESQCIYSNMLMALTQDQLELFLKQCCSWPTK